MRNVFFMMIFFLIPFTITSAIRSSDINSAPSTSTEIIKPGYALVMVNGSKIRMQEYQVNLKYDTVSYKSSKSGLTATFPLERVSKIIKFDNSLEKIPEEALVVFQNAASLNQVKDDGGIPILFKVTKTVVGSQGSTQKGTTGGKSTGQFTSKGSSGTSSRNSSSSGTSSFGNATSRSSSSFSSSKSQSSSSGRSSSSFSNNSNDDFFNALFGGNK